MEIVDCVFLRGNHCSALDDLYCIKSRKKCKFYKSAFVSNKDIEEKVIFYMDKYNLTNEESFKFVKRKMEVCSNVNNRRRK